MIQTYSMCINWLKQLRHNYIERNKTDAWLSLALNVWTLEHRAGLAFAMKDARFVASLSSINMGYFCITSLNLLTYVFNLNISNSMDILIKASSDRDVMTQCLAESNLDHVNEEWCGGRGCHFVMAIKIRKSNACTEFFLRMQLLVMHPSTLTPK